MVLPEPVPPTTTNAFRFATIPRTSAALFSSSAPRATRSSSVAEAVRSTRREMHVPAWAVGASTAWKRSRVPSSRVTCPSQNGCASSNLRPQLTARRVASRLTEASESNVSSERSNPWPVSTYTSSGALTQMSVTAGSARIASNGPAPVVSSRSLRMMSSTPMSLITTASSRMIAATRAGSGWAGSSARRRFTRASTSSI